MKNWNVRKTVVTREEMPEEHRLKQSLSWPHLVALGVGAIVGTGILTLIGVGAGKAGPAVILSFAIAGVICACAALAYAEVATMIPASGSAYTYSYVVFGELIAWIIGWSLILEYSLVVSAVAVGWSGYAAPLIHMPFALANGPELGGIVNLPAIFIIAAVATAAEETRNPDRDLAIGIVGSMVLCVAIYMAVAAAAIGAIAYTRFADSPEPLALILRQLGQPWAAWFLAVSAVVALPTVILAFFFGQSRIFFTMARDGLLPPVLAKVSKRGSPVRITIFTAIVVAVIAGLFPLAEIAALANAGTLAAFVAVCAAMLTLRVREPDRLRKFRAPVPWVVGIGGIVGCLYLFVSLPVKTPLFFLTAQLIGGFFYAIYGSRAAERARAAAAT